MGGSAKAGAARRRTGRMSTSCSRAAADLRRGHLDVRAPAPGHTPVLVCVGETPNDYEPVWPPTLMMNKAPRTTSGTRRSPGVRRTGIARCPRRGGRRTARSVRRPRRPRGCLGRPGRARRDRRAYREPCSTRKAIGVCVEGRDPTAAAALVERRDELQALLQRRLMRIASIETRVYRCPLDPPFTAAWDPVPRTHQDATVVIVRSDDGVEGYASGDALPDRELLERLLVGRELDPTEIHGVLETVDFHHGRNWTLEVAVWDLLGRAEGKPLWKLLGGERDRIGAYASTGELVSPDERVRRCVALRDGGVRAVKIRLHSTDWTVDLPVIEAVRTAVGSDLDIMVDANQGWRMPGDLTPRWSRATAHSPRSSSRSACTGSRSHSRPTTSTATHDSSRRRACESPRAMVRSETRRAISGTRRRRRHPARRRPQRWARGRASYLGTHGRTDPCGACTPGRTATASSPTSAALAFSTCPHLEVPFDPPTWSAERRNWLLPVTIEIDDDGTVRLRRRRSRRHPRLR